MKKHLQQCLFVLLYCSCTTVSISAQEGYGPASTKDVQAEEVLKQLISATGDKNLTEGKYQVRLVTNPPHKTVWSECPKVDGKLLGTIFIGSEFRERLTKEQLMAVLSHELGHWVNQVVHDPPGSFKWLDHEIAANRYAIKTLVLNGFGPETARQLVGEILEKSFAFNPCKTVACKRNKQLLFDAVSIPPISPR